MEFALRVQVEELPEGLFLATSSELEGLVAQGRTVAEARDIARDVARKILEARRDRDGSTPPEGIVAEHEHSVVVVV